jgi:dephospho-CoA kinase
MHLIGVTGGIGCGKSFLTRHLQSQNMPVVDTDQVARALLQPGEDALTELHDHFGDTFFNPDGSLNRVLFSQRVFNDPEAMKWLEDLLHPRIRWFWETKVKEWTSNQEIMGVVVIPLLFETHLETRFDSIICMACSSTTQRERLLARGWSLSHIHDRLAAQWPLIQKMNASHHVIWTDAHEATTLAQWELLLEHIKAIGSPPS